MTADTHGPQRLTEEYVVPDAHGQAALLLVESLIHGLIANERLTVSEAITIVDVAAEVKAEIALEGREPLKVATESYHLLTRIAISLDHDAQR